MLKYESHTKPEKAAVGLYIATQVVTFGFLVSGWCLTSDIRKSAALHAADAALPGGAMAFDVVWTTLMVLAAGAFVGAVLPVCTRAYLTPVTFGASVAALIAVTNILLLTAVRYGSPANASSVVDQGVAALASAKATAAFAALSFLLHLALLAVVVLYRYSILKEPMYGGDTAAAASASSVPHGQPYPVSSYSSIPVAAPPPLPPHALLVGGASAPPRSPGATSTAGAAATPPSAVVGHKAPGALGSIDRNPFTLFAADDLSTATGGSTGGGGIGSAGGAVDVTTGIGTADSSGRGIARSAIASSTGPVTSSDSPVGAASLASASAPRFVSSGAVAGPNPSVSAAAVRAPRKPSPATVGSPEPGAAAASLTSGAAIARAPAPLPHSLAAASATPLLAPPPRPPKSASAEVLRQLAAAQQLAPASTGGASPFDPVPLR